MGQDGLQRISRYIPKFMTFASFLGSPSVVIASSQCILTLQSAMAGLNKNNSSERLIDYLSQFMILL